MKIHFFTVPFCLFSLLVLKNKRKRASFFPPPQKTFSPLQQNILLIFSGSVEIFVY